jgi:hypothetical protein
MSRRRFPALDDLIRQAEQAAAEKPDLVGLLVEMIRLAGDRGTDPYLLVGLIVEGAVETLAKHIPPERRRDAGAAMLKLLLDRLSALELE